jgi:hypothetical protein
MKPTGKHGHAHRYAGTSRTDRAFDRLLPDELRRMSPMHWTPANVAVRVAALLAPGAGSRILDVGAGVGKLCSIGALSAGGTWFGVEQHEPLVTVARQVARGLGVAQRTVFVHGDAFELEWNDFDALYMYNPFEPPLFPRSIAADHRVQVARVQQRLARLPATTRVVTLHGFGGVMPTTFELVYHEQIPSVGLDLALWIQRSRPRHRVAVS